MGTMRLSVLDGCEVQRRITPRQPHRPRHLASKAHRVFFSCILLRRRCRNLCQTKGVATSPCSVSRRFTTRQLMLSLLNERSSSPLGIYIRHLVFAPPTRMGS